MPATCVRTPIANMSDAEFNELLSALGRAREHARLLMREARLPECAAFGAIALDLEYSISILGQSAPPISVTPAGLERTI